MTMAGGKHYVLLVSEQRFYLPNLDAKQGWHDRMCITMKSSCSRLSYNTKDGDDKLWNQYGGTGVTLTADMKSPMVAKDADPSKLGRRTWVSFEGKVGESTVFVSAYCPCKSITGISTV